MQPVTNFDENNTYIIAHCEQKLLEILCLGRRFIAEYAAANLCQSVDYLCNLRAEDVFNILDSIIRIFDYIVEQGRTDAGRPESHLFTGNLSNRNGMHYVWFAGQSTHSFMCLTRKMESLSDDIHLLAMA